MSEQPKPPVPTLSAEESIRRTLRSSCGWYEAPHTEYETCRFCEAEKALDDALTEAAERGIHVLAQELLQLHGGPTAIVRALQAVLKRWPLPT